MRLKKSVKIQPFISLSIWSLAICELGHNFFLLHRRDAFDVSSDTVSERHLLRLWLGAPDGWPLPEVYRSTREYGPLFAVRDPIA